MGLYSRIFLDKKGIISKIRISLPLMAVFINPSETIVINLFQKYWQNLLVVLTWFGLALGYYIYTVVSGHSAMAAMSSLVELLSNNPSGLLLYVGIFGLRSLVLFPASLWVVAGGYLFGPGLGLIAAMAGCTISALIVYILGYYLGRDILKARGNIEFIEPYLSKIGRQSFLTVLIMRCLWMPFDLVSCLAGFLRIALKPFLAATIIGTAPSALALVLLGASVQGDFSDVRPGFNPWLFVASIFLMVVSLLISKHLKKREAGGTPPTP